MTQQISLLDYAESILGLLRQAELLAELRRTHVRRWAGEDTRSSLAETCLNLLKDIYLAQQAHGENEWFAAKHRRVYELIVENSTQVWCLTEFDRWKEK